MEKVLVLDCETESIEKGHPFHPDNFMCTVHYFSFVTKEIGTIKFHHPTPDYAVGDKVEQLQKMIDDHDILVGFNFKFDLHWFRRYGVKFESKEIRDVQFLYGKLNHCLNKMPSLDHVLEELGLPKKLDILKEYWDRGIKTSQVPYDELVLYGETDIKRTTKAYARLWRELKSRADPALDNLFRISMVDLLFLEEAEWNGMLYNLVKGEEVRVQLEQELVETDEEIKSYVPEIAKETFNPGSGDQLSALLYGGKVPHTYYTKIGVFKTGQRAGQDKYKKVTDLVTLQGFVKPRDKWKTKKDGIYQTNADILDFIVAKARGKGQRIAELARTRAKLNKTLSSYSRKIPVLVEQKGWEKTPDGRAYLHGNLNMCVAITGRLSSSDPNQQNIDGRIKYLFESRYDD